MKKFTILTSDTQRPITYLIDDIDAGLLTSYQWRVAQSTDGRYKRRVKPYLTALSGYMRTTVYLHRLIVNAERGETVRFRNGDATDLRRQNLFVPKRERKARKP